MQNPFLSFNARLCAVVTRFCARRFSDSTSSRSNISSTGSTGNAIENSDSIISSNSSVGPIAKSAASASNQHLIEFQLSSSASTRLDVSIVSHFRVNGTPHSENRRSLTNDSRRHSPPEPSSHTPAAVPLKVRPLRGREGRQQHSAKLLESVRVPASTAASPPSLMPKSTFEDSRRKSYENRRAERQRLREAELDLNVEHSSELSGGTVEDVFEDDEDVYEFGPDATAAASISVNNRDFDYFMNVTASLASRQRVSQLIENGMVSVNGSPVASKSHILAEGIHAVSVSLPFGSINSEVSVANASPFPILYEDDALLVIGKPAGIIVHPSPSVQDADSPSVVSRLLEHGFLLPASQFAIHRFIHNFCHHSSRAFCDLPFVILPIFALRAGLVHRLDRDTSGCLLIAKTHLALAALSKQFADRSVTKRYLAVVHGCPGHVVLRQRISSPQHMIPGKDRRARIAVSADSSHGKSAVTAVSTLSSGRGLSVVEALIGTGRTHQIRVHLSSVGCPVFGDTLYGSSGSSHDLEQFKTAVTASRPMLHAHTLVFKHPLTLKDITVTAPLPEDMLSLLRELAPSIWPPSSMQRCV